MMQLQTDWLQEPLFVGKKKDASNKIIVSMDAALSWILRY